jgi:N-acyl-D-aspartate/D-glutamate deacylase
MGAVDVLFRGATVYDGSGAAGRQTDVAIHGDRVVALGGDAASVLGAVPRVVDAGGLALAPGFIDLHSHADHTLPAFPRATNSLSQGVTTELVGLCGFSPAPVAPERERADALRSLVHGLGPDLDWSWQAFGAFLDRMAAARPAVNVAALVGHHALRIAAMGMADRAPRADELAAMRVELQTALDAGAWGMSTGLVYAPGAFAATDELVSIGEPLTRADALYVSHIRDEGDDLFQAVDEALEIGDRLGIRTQISHLKALGRRNAGKVAGAVERLQAGRTRGVRVHCDVYPYTAGSTFLHQLLPPWIKEGGLEQMVERLGAADQRLRVRHDVEHGVPGWTSYLDATGGWHNILIASVASPERRQAEGRRLDDLANEARLDPLEYALDLLVADRGATVMIAFSMDEADVREALRCPVAAIGSDQLGVTSPGARVHPRAYGTFARVLGWGVREAQLFELEQAIHRMTGRPASILGLTDRGRVAPGAVADLVLFDPATIADQATYEDPTRPARGVEHVLVGGEPAVEAGRIVRADLGRVLRRGADNGR